MDTQQKARLVADRTLELLETARKLYPSVQDLNVYIKFSPKLAKRALAFAKRINAYGITRYEIEYNVEGIVQDVDYYLKQTVPHELAHIIAFYIGCDDGHGPMWGKICRSLGGEPNRTAKGFNGAISRAKKGKKYEYVASCGTTVWLSSIRHTRVQRGSHYRLGATGGRVERQGFTGKYKVLQ